MTKPQNDGEVQVNDSGEVVGTGNDARIALLNSIGDQHDRDRSEELADVNDDDTTTKFVIDGEVEPKVEDPTEEVAEVEEKEEVPSLPKIKVNGEEIDLTPELIAKAQKIASADKYLAEAKAPKKEEPEQVDKTAEIEAQRLEEELALVRALQMGTQEEALAALRKLRQSVAPSITKDEISRLADERLAFNSAIEWFNTEYQDLIDDPKLHQMVMSRDNELLKEGDARNYKERYKAIGEEVREWRDSVVKKYAPEKSSTELQTKEEKKKLAPKPLTAATKRAANPVPEDEGEEDPSDVIAAMAKHRGGPQWLRS